MIKTRKKHAYVTWPGTIRAQLIDDGVQFGTIEWRRAWHREYRKRNPGATKESTKKYQLSKGAAHWAAKERARRARLRALNPIIRCTDNFKNHRWVLNRQSVPYKIVKQCVRCERVWKYSGR